MSTRSDDEDTLSHVVWERDDPEPVFSAAPDPVSNALLTHYSTISGARQTANAQPFVLSDNPELTPKVARKGGSVPAPAPNRNHLMNFMGLSSRGGGVSSSSTAPAPSVAVNGLSKEQLVNISTADINFHVKLQRKLQRDPYYAFGTIVAGLVGIKVEQLIDFHSIPEARREFVEIAVDGGSVRTPTMTEEDRQAYNEMIYKANLEHLKPLPLLVGGIEAGLIQIRANYPHLRNAQTMNFITSPAKGLFAEVVAANIKIGGFNSHKNYSADYSRLQQRLQHAVRACIGLKHDKDGIVYDNSVIDQDLKRQKRLRAEFPWLSRV